MGAASAANGAKPNRETWVDWLPPGVPEPAELLTRHEMIEHLRRYNITTHTNELRYWEYAGVLPRPVRRWHHGATRALYPPWFGRLVRRVQVLRERGYTLPQIRPRLRAYVADAFGAPGAPTPETLPDEIDIETGEPVSASPPYWNIVDGPEDIALSPTLTGAVGNLAALHARYTGVAVERVEIRVIDADGGETRYLLPQRPTNGDVGGTE